MSETRAAWRRFDWRLLLATRAVIIVAAVVATVATLAVWPAAPIRAPQIYAFADIVLSCIAVSRLRSAGWIFVAVHLIVAAAWCEAIWQSPARWFE